MTNTTATATYRIGEAVEVRTIDFKAAGQPVLWVEGTVYDVAVVDGKLLDVTVATDEGVKAVRTTYRSRAALRPAGA
ncbi:MULTISPECIES: hypothetical protein [unclassified Microbacterium]|uniref:hypothetical protein n=1 Tax=unclassified Microbacterium TaxID=2609290 RepID=UPI0004249B9F|nr:hypothetical protein [Microbacterium sp. B24]